MNERLKTLRKFLYPNRSLFALKIGVSDRTVENWEKGKTYPDLNHLYKIWKMDSRINLNWIITGEGKMLTNENENFFPVVSYLKEKDTPGSIVDHPLLNYIELIKEVEKLRIEINRFKKK